MEDKSEVAVIDANKHEVVAHWSLAPGEEPSGIALDATHPSFVLGLPQQNDGDARYRKRKSRRYCFRLAPASMAVRSMTQGQLAFASCGDGTTTIAKEEAPDKLTVLQNFGDRARARETMTLDPKSHRIYLPSAQFSNRHRQPSPGAPPGTTPPLCPTHSSFSFTVPAESVKH